MKKISEEKLREQLQKRVPGEKMNLSDCLLENLNLSGWNLHEIAFDRCDFRGVDLSHADMSGCTAKNALFRESILKSTNLSNAILCSADFRGCDLSGADISGADMHAAALYKADLTDIKSDENTRYFHMRCPKEGAFIGWKVCYGRRVVQLLIPADAVRIQGTWEEIKCDKAKVLTIKSIDYQETYEEAHSYVDENFIYRRGEMVYAKNFNPDRFAESGGGIHIWLNREEAVAYLG